MHSQLGRIGSSCRGAGIGTVPVRSNKKRKICAQNSRYNDKIDIQSIETYILEQQGNR